MASWYVPPVAQILINAYHFLIAIIHAFFYRQLLINCKHLVKARTTKATPPVIALPSKAENKQGTIAS